jgi:hypothetical protein
LILCGREAAIVRAIIHSIRQKTGKNRGDKMLELGTIVMVDHPRHPFNGCVGKVVGRRGNRTPEDAWILIYFSSKMRSYLIPESILSPQKAASAPIDETVH